MCRLQSTCPDFGLDQIEETEEEFRIGCMVTLRQMELHEGLSYYTEGAVKDAFRHIVGVQFRNLATVGGSLFGRIWILRCVDTSACIRL